MNSNSNNKLTRGIIPILASSVLVIGTALVDIPWKRSLCGVIGYGLLLSAWMLEKYKRNYSTDHIQHLRMAGYVSLIGTVGYTHGYDAFMVSGILLAITGWPRAMATTTSLYYVMGLQYTQNIYLVILRVCIVLLLTIGLRNPLIK